MIFSVKRITAFTVALALFMDVLDTSIINTAIPTMAQSFQVSPIDLKIALISYLLSLAIFIPTSGWAADKYGAKSVFIAALGLFTVTSFMCGYAHTLPELVIARFIQGIGGAFMISLGKLIIAHTFKRHELVRAMNMVIIVVSVGVMLGPYVGGVITDYLSWPWIFWVNIPAGIVTMLLAVYGLQEMAPKNLRPFDWLGFILFGGSLALVCFSLSEISESTIAIYSALLMLAIAVGLFAAYVLHMQWQRHPIVQLKLLGIRTIRISILGNIFSRLGFGGVPFLLPLLQQIGLGFSAKLSGLLLVPTAFGIIFSKLFVTRILQWVGYKKYLCINTLLVSVAVWLLQLITVHTSLYMIASFTFVFGVAVAAQSTGMNSLAFADIKENELSASTSITSTVQVLAQSLGVAISAILLRFYTSTSLPLTPTIFHQVFFSLGVITCLSALIFLGLKSDDGKQMLSANTPS